MQSSREGVKQRVVRHRAKRAAQGARRVEVTVPAQDVGIVKAIAGVLRMGGDEARRVRDTLASLTAVEPVRTGADLLAFLRASPLVGEDLTIERDRTPGRMVDFE